MLERPDGGNIVASLSYSVLAFLWQLCFFLLGWLLRPEWQFLFSFGALPFAEMELFTLSANLLSMSPIWGALCLIFLAPVTPACRTYHGSDCAWGAILSLMPSNLIAFLLLSASFLLRM